MKNYHLNFSKEIGNIKVSSYGGGAPRWTKIERTDRDDMSIETLSMENVRDLHYALGRLIDQCADD